MGILPLIALGGLILVLHRGGASVRESVLRGALLFGVVVALGTEALSAMSALEIVPVLILWLGVLAGVAVQWWRLRSAGVVRRRPTFDLREGVLLGAISVPVILTAIIAIVSAPNTWDGMTYHMSRVTHWMSDQTLAPYATNIDRQLWLNPWSEFLVLHLQLLDFGADRLANMVQWLGYVGSLVAVADVTCSLGGTLRHALFAALLVACMPTAIVQSTSTQTDLVATFWITCGVALALRQVRVPSWGWRSMIWLGLATGLAVSAKGTAYFFVPWWILVFLGPALREKRWGFTLRAVGVIGACFLVLNAGQLYRNLAVYHNPFGSPVTQRLLRLSPLTVGTAISSLIVHASLQLATPWQAVNHFVMQAIAALHASVLDIDLRQLYPYFGGFRIIPLSVHEDVAGSPLHFLLGLVATGVVVLQRRKHPRLLRYLAAVWLGYLLLAMMVRWQPFAARFQLPTLVLLSPAVALSLLGPAPRARIILLLSIALAAVPALLTNETRPMLPVAAKQSRRVPRVFLASREDQYFAARPSLEASYQRAADDLAQAGCRFVALKSGYDSAEYPLWALVRSRGLNVQFQHVQVENASRDWLPATVPGPPCAYLAIEQPRDRRPPPPLTAMTLVWRDGVIALWR